MQTFLYFSFSCLIITSIIVFSRHLTTSNNGEILPPQHLLDDVAINCGCLLNYTSLDGRYWVGEQQTPPLLHPNGKSRRTSTSAHNLLSADPTPYLTARISSTYFSYNFQLNPGHKFIRLHFCPVPYQGFKNSQDFFTVKANSFTLLQNFSASLAACALGVKYIVKEFCLNVNETGNLQLTFFASQGSSKKIKNHAFINGIEIISMPTGLYYTPDGNLGPPVVGHTNYFYNIDNSTALELIQRLNVGGGSILSVEDTSMFRRWSEDADYILEYGFHQVDNLVLGIEYMNSLPFYIAPLRIYRTSRRLTKNMEAEELYYFNWKLPVDIGFSYLLRLHFYEFGVESVESSGQEFDILVQNLVAETRANVIRWSGGKGIPVYRDYLVKLRGDKAEGKCDLFISLQSVDDLVVGTLKGIEIFKLSNTDNTLASPNPSCSKCSSSFWNLKFQNLSFGHFDFFMTALIVLLVIVHKFRQICDRKLWQEKEVQSVPIEPSCCYFSLAEIMAATQNFNDALVIGRGGFGKVYKGFVDGHPQILAIKRLKSDSKQGAHEFWREIETLSKLRHVHLVSLIGYCNENKEMILVYEYMPRGTIADNLYKAGRNGEEAVPLTWQQRLRICIGAARGLDYLHTGTENGVVHRDVKDTNILLDENFFAKISDFGLSKLGRIRETQSQISTKVQGTIGYVDPDYIMTHKPSEKSDVYGYGIVLLVVLSGRPALEAKVYGETRSVLSCFRECITRGQFNEIIDPCLQGEISVESLQIFTEVVENCLHHSPKDRLSMAHVVVQLENAFGKQHSSMASVLDDRTIVTRPGLSSPKKSFGSYKLQLPSTPEESMVIAQEVESSSKQIGNIDLQTGVQVLLSRKKDRMTTQKPFWGRPWNALRSKLTEPIFSLNTIRSATKNCSMVLRKPLERSVYVHKVFISGVGPVYVGFTEFYTYRANKDQREIELLTKVRHVHLVPLLGCCIESCNLIVVYGYMSNGTLEDYLYSSNTSTRNDAYSLTWEVRLRICIDAARGLRYLHEDGIVHGNLEVSSIMLDENFKAKISDFWLAKLVPCDFFFDSLDLAYLDPSYLHTGKSTIATDVYNFGIILLVVLSGRPAHQLKHQNLPWYEMCLKVKEYLDPNLEEKPPSASLGTFVHLIKICLRRVQKRRPVMAQVEELLVKALKLALREIQPAE